MYEAPQTQLDPNAAQAILAEIAPTILPVKLPHDKTLIQVADLPFYKDYKFYALTDMTLPPPNVRYMLYKPGDVSLMNWTNEPIYSVNEKAPIILDRKTLVPYAKFFFHFVRGQLGRFVIVEKPEDMIWLPMANDRRYDKLAAAHFMFWFLRTLNCGLTNNLSQPSSSGRESIPEEAMQLADIEALLTKAFGRIQPSATNFQHQLETSAASHLAQYNNVLINDQAKARLLLARALGAYGTQDISQLRSIMDELLNIQKQEVHARQMPVTYKGIGRDNLFTLTCTVVFKNALFRTDIKVAPYEMDVFDQDLGGNEHFTIGQMKLTNEELLLEELNVPIDPPPGEFG